MSATTEWDRRVEQFWQSADGDDVEGVLTAMKALVADRPAGDAAA